MFADDRKIEEESESEREREVLANVPQGTKDVGSARPCEGERPALRRLH
jgi:hypothetical protein